MLDPQCSSDLARFEGLGARTIAHGRSSSLRIHFIMQLLLYSLDELRRLILRAPSCYFTRDCMDKLEKKNRLAIFVRFALL